MPPLLGFCDAVSLYMQHRLLPIPVEIIHALGVFWFALEVAFFALVRCSWLPTINIRTQVRLRSSHQRVWCGLSPSPLIEPVQC